MKKKEITKLSLLKETITVLTTSKEKIVGGIFAKPGEVDTTRPGRIDTTRPGRVDTTRPEVPDTTWKN